MVIFEFMELLFERTADDGARSELNGAMCAGWNALLHSNEQSPHILVGSNEGNGCQTADNDLFCNSLLHV